MCVTVLARPQWRGKGGAGASAEVVEGVDGEVLGLMSVAGVGVGRPGGD